MTAIDTTRPATTPGAASTVNLLCAGALKGLVQALQPRLAAEQGLTIEGRFGAVGAMREALLAGAACDVLIVTQAMVAALVAEGRLVADSVRPLGVVKTGVCVRSGTPAPDISTPDQLRAALLGASALYFPDPARATAGIHFERVLRELGILDAVGARLRTAPNGAVAMRALGDSAEAGLIGCTQITEICYTDGVTLIGALPPPFELATVYSAAISTSAASPAQAAALIEGLAGPDSKALRAAGGFEA